MDFGTSIFIASLVAVNVFIGLEMEYWENKIHISAAVFLFTASILIK